MLRLPSKFLREAKDWHVASAYLRLPQTKHEPTMLIVPVLRKCYVIDHPTMAALPASKAILWKTRKARSGLSLERSRMYFNGSVMADLDASNACQAGLVLGSVLFLLGPSFHARVIRHPLGHGILINRNTFPNLPSPRRGKS